MAFGSGFAGAAAGAAATVPAAAGPPTAAGAAFFSATSCWTSFSSSATRASSSFSFALSAPARVDALISATPSATAIERRSELNPGGAVT
ncbi:MAG: hypothetical protein IPJ97_18650 [Proteobacteria bacterium]|nr:hypothetical protein [Pseudomonadota bacterium]